MSDFIAGIKLKIDYSDVSSFMSSMRAEIDRAEGMRAKAAAPVGGATVIAPTSSSAARDEERRRNSPQGVIYGPTGQVISRVQGTSDEEAKFWARREAELNRMSGSRFVALETGVQNAHARGQMDLGSSSDYLGAYRRNEIATADLWARKNAAVLGVNDKGEVTESPDSPAFQLRGVAAASKQVIDTFTNISKYNNLDPRTAAAGHIAEQEFKRARDRIVAQQKPGSFFQNLQYLSNPNGTAPANRPTLGQFMGRHATNTLGYAIPGIAIGVGFEEIRMAVDEAARAQKAMAEVRAEFEGLNQSSQYSGFAQSIHDIASNTGLAVSEVADLGMAMKGVFGDTTQAEVALKGVAMAAQAMGLSVREAQDDLTAIDQAFAEFKNSGGAAIGQISNQALHLQDVFGVQAKEIVAGTADLGPIANQLGLNSNTTMSLIASTAQRTGENPATIASGLGKIMPGFTQNLASMEAYYNQVPALQGSRQAFMGDLQSGQMGQAFMQMISDFKNLPASMQVAITQSLGGNPSSQAILLQASQGAGKAMAHANDVAPANRTQQEFQKQMSTLAGEMERFRSSAQNLGVAILNSGLGKGLSEIVQGGSAFVEFLSRLNEDTHGLVGDVAALTAGILALKAAFSAFNVVKEITQGMRNLGTATAETALKTEADTVAEEANTAATVQNSEAQTANIVARGRAGLGALLGQSVGAAGFGTAAMGVGIAGITGYQLGSEIYKLTQQKGMVGDVARAAAAPVQVPAEILGHLLGGGGPHDTTKFANQQQEYINQHIKQIRALEGVASPADQARIEKDLKSDTHLNAYNDLLSVYARVGQSAAGQTALRPLNAVSQAAAKKQQAAANLQKQQQIELQDWSAVSSQYQAGKASYNQLVGVAQQTLQQAQDAYNNAPSFQTLEALATAQQQLNQVVTQAIQAQQQFQQSITQQGSISAQAALRQNLRSSVANSNDPTLLQSTANNIVQSYQTQLQNQAAMATDAIQANRIMQAGIQVSPEDLAVINKARTAQGLAALSSLTIPGQQVTPEQQIQALQQLLQAQGQVAQANAFEDPVKMAQAQLQNVQAQMASYLNNGGSKTDSSYIQLQAQYTEAQHQLIDAQNQVTQAQMGYFAAFFSPDGVRAAQYAVAQAQAAVNAAHGAAAQLQAQAQLAQAQQQLNTAIIQYGDSVNAVTMATFTAQGNPIAAAWAQYQQDLKDAAQIAAFDKSRGIDPSQTAEYQNAVAKSFTDLANYQQTLVSTLTQNVQTQLFLGQITATQAIVQLEGALSQVKGNYLETQALLQAIRQIQNSAGANLNFDIPQNLLINPTLYQAARVSQLGGSAYQGTRQVSVTIQVNNPSQNPGAVNQLMQALGGPAVGSIVSSALATPGM